MCFCCPEACITLSPAPAQLFWAAPSRHYFHFPFSGWEHLSVAGYFAILAVYFGKFLLVQFLQLLPPQGLRLCKHVARGAESSQCKCAERSEGESKDAVWRPLYLRLWCGLKSSSLLLPILRLLWELPVPQTPRPSLLPPGWRGHVPGKDKWELADYTPFLLLRERCFFE